jgi:hypothetical protein
MVVTVTVLMLRLVTGRAMVIGPIEAIETVKREMTVTTAGIRMYSLF